MRRKQRKKKGRQKGDEKKTKSKKTDKTFIDCPQFRTQMIRHWSKPNLFQFPLLIYYRKFSKCWIFDIFAELEIV